MHRCDQPLVVQIFRGIRCTTPIRTLIDLAAVVPTEAVAAALDRALASRLVRLRDLDDATRAGGGVRGIAVLRRCLQQRGYVGGPGPSVLESRMARLFTRYRLPKPSAEVVWGDGREYRLDFAYPAIKLAIEVYGYAWHHSPDQLAHDLARQRRLVSAGWTVLAYTWRQLARRPTRCGRGDRRRVPASQCRGLTGRDPRAKASTPATRGPRAGDPESRVECCQRRSHAPPLWRRRRRPEAESRKS